MKLKRSRIISWSITVILLFLAIFTIYRELHKYHDQVIPLIKEADLRLVPILLALQVAGYFIVTEIETALLAIIKIKTTFWTNFRIAVGNELGGEMLPVVGGAAAAYISYRRALKMTEGMAIFMATAWGLLYLTSFVFFVLLSEFFLPREITARIPDLGIIIWSGVLFLAAIFYYLLAHEARKFVSLVQKLVHFLNRASVIFLKREVVQYQKLTVILEDIRSSIKLFVGNKNKLIKPFSLLLAFFATDLAIMYLCFRSFNFLPNLALMVFGFTGGSLLTLLFPTSATPGVSEAANTLAFIALGFPPHIALFAVLLFRIVTYWVWIPFSAFYFFRLNKLNPN